MLHNKKKKNKNEKYLSDKKSYQSRYGDTFRNIIFNYNYEVISLSSLSFPAIDVEAADCPKASSVSHGSNNG